MTVQIDVELNEKWRDDIAELHTEFESLDGSKADLEANIRPAQREIAELRADLQTLTTGEHTVDVDADIDHESIKKSVKSLNNLEVDDVDIDLGDAADVDDIDIGIEIDDDAEDVLGVLSDLEKLERDQDADRRRSYRVNTTRTTSYDEFVDQEYNPENKEAKVWYDEELRTFLMAKDKEATIHYDEELNEDASFLKELRDEDGELGRSGTIQWRSRGGHGPSSARGTVKWSSNFDTTDFLNELRDAKKTAAATGTNKIEFEAYTNGLSAAEKKEKGEVYFHSRLNRSSLRDEISDFKSELAGTNERSLYFDPELRTDKFTNDLGRLLGDLDNMDTELEIEVCLKKCDDWDKTLNEIGADFDAIKEWEERDGRVDVRLRGAVDELSDVIDDFEDSDLQPDTEVGRMARAANQGGSEWDMMKDYLGLEDEDDDSSGDDSFGDDFRGTDESVWSREDRKWMSGGMGQALVAENNAQKDRVDNAAKKAGVGISYFEDRVTPEDIVVTADMEDGVIRELYGDDVADSPAANFHRDEANDVARKRAFADLVREFDSTSGYGFDGLRRMEGGYKDHSDHGDFGIPGYGDDEITASDVVGERSETTMPTTDEYRGPLGVRHGMGLHSEAREKWENAKAIADSRRDKFSVDGAGIGNILDKEHGTNPFTLNEQKLMDLLGVDMKDSGFFDPDNDSGMAAWYKSVSNRRTGSGGLFNFSGNMKRWKKGGGSTNFGKILGFGGLPGFGGGGGGTGGGPGGMKKLKRFMPTMAKYWQFIATLSPMLITLAANAAGVAAAMGSIAVAGGAVIGLGLLGFGETLSESMREAKQRMKEFKKEMFGAFQPALKQFSPFTEAFMATAPVRVDPLVQSMKGLTEFVDTFNDAFDGAIEWAAEFIDTVVALEPILSQLGMRFGSIIGGLITDAFRWFTTEAHKNQDVMIAVGEAIFNVLRVLYKFAEILTFLTAILSPFLGMLAWVASFISERWVAAFLAGAGAIYAIASAVGVLTGAFSTLLATQLSSMAASIASFAATAITSFLAAAEALAVLIAGQATLLTMTGAGLALVAAGIAAGYVAYQAIAPSGTTSHMGGGGAGAAPGVGTATSAGGRGSGASTGGSTGKTVINVEGDITRASIGDVEDAVQKNHAQEVSIEENRNP